MFPVSLEVSFNPKQRLTTEYRMLGSWKSVAKYQHNMYAAPSPCPPRIMV